MLKSWNGFCAVVICSSGVLGCRGKSQKKNNDNVGGNDYIVTPVPFRTSGDLSQATLDKRVHSHFEVGKQVGQTEEFFNEKGLLVTKVELKTSAKGQHEEISREEHTYNQWGNTLKIAWVKIHNL